MKHLLETPLTLQVQILGTLKTQDIYGNRGFIGMSAFHYWVKVIQRFSHYYVLPYA